MEKQTAFDPAFEEKLIQSILIDHDFGEQIMEVMDPDYFDMVHTETFSSVLKRYFNKYETFPSADLLPSIIGEDVSNPMVLKKCNKFLEKIQNKPLNGDLEYVKERALEFFRKQHITKTLSEDVLPLLSGETSRLEEILPIIQKALTKGTENDVGYDYFDDEEDRFNIELEKTVPTCWSIVNKMVKGGGWGEGRVVTFIAPGGAGKTTCLVNCGKAALLEGMTVVYYTFELSWREIAEKFDATLTDTEIGDIPGSKKEVLACLKAHVPPGARLIIKQYPVRGASIQTIKAHLAKLKLKGTVPHMIIIDQGGNMKSSTRNNKEERFNLSDNWLDMKNLAQVQKVPVVTAHQVNRTGYNDDLILPDQIAGCFDIIGTTDILITMARNIAQKQLGLGKMLFAKNRQGKDGVVLAYAMNSAKAHIEVFELTEAVEEMFSKAATEQAASAERNLSNKLESYVMKKREKGDKNG